MKLKVKYEKSTGSIGQHEEELPEWFAEKPPWSVADLDCVKSRLRSIQLENGAYIPYHRVYEWRVDKK